MYNRFDISEEKATDQD